MTLIGCKMTRLHQKLTQVERLVRNMFAEFGDFQLNSVSSSVDDTCDLKLFSEASNREYHFQIKVRERITPQIANELFARLKSSTPKDNSILIVFAPVISPRVAELAIQNGISYLDGAGNCRIVDAASHLAIFRTGLSNEASYPKQKAVDLFAPKSSRILRAMLHEPTRGWQLAELATMPEVDVSVGLVFKVKQALVEESYAVVRDRLLYLNRPVELLAAWARNQPDQLLKRQFYVRGDLEKIEGNIAKWCEKEDIKYALARFSAAWRYAPEVRYSVATVYLSAEAFGIDRLASIEAECGAKEVDSGANLVLLAPFDKSVFTGRIASPEQTTSPLQTYLDLQSMAGRGVEAAKAVYDKHLRESFESVHTANGSAS